MHITKSRVYCLPESLYDSHFHASLCENIHFISLFLSSVFIHSFDQETHRLFCLMFFITLQKVLNFFFMPCDIVIYIIRTTYLVFVPISGTELLMRLEISKCD